MNTLNWCRVIKTKKIKTWEKIKKLKKYEKREILCFSGTNEHKKYADKVKEFFDQNTEIDYSHLGECQVKPAKIIVTKKIEKNLVKGKKFIILFEFFIIILKISEFLF